MFRADATGLRDAFGHVKRERVAKEPRRRMLSDPPNPEIKHAALARQRIAMYYGNLAHLDDCLGRVLASLRELDLEKDTIVIYGSDHGEMLGEHGLWHKFVFYEPSAGVPLFIRVPGLTREGSRSPPPITPVSFP